MTAEIPTTEPKSVTAGDTVQWNKDSLSDYLASAGWTLTYALRNAAGKIDITASANGGGYSVSVAAATTADWVAGQYSWQAYVTKAAERFKVGSGTIEVLPNFATENSFDDRSHAKTVLDAIEAVIESRASVDQESYSIMGRSLKRTPMADLLKLRDKYKALYLMEQNAENAKNGKPGKNRILARL